MSFLLSIINKIQSIIFNFPSICYAADTDGTNLDLNIPDSGFENLTKITPNDFIAGAISIALVATIIVFFFIFLLGGLKWITSSGDEKKIATARSQITNGVVGFFIILSSWAILGLIGTLFNIDLLKLTIPSFIKNPTENSNSEKKLKNNPNIKLRG